MILLPITLYSVLFASVVKGSALNNNTSTNVTQYADRYVGYVQDPSGRGTASLVLSCLLTLILCVWSALHLNVPEKNRNAIKTLWMNFRWIVAGIYSPELVVFAAWRQWCSARMLNREIKLLIQSQTINNTHHDEQDNKLAKNTHHEIPWSMAHSFFACSGGFALELGTLTGSLATDSGLTDQENTKPTRLTLTARGVLMLARSGHLPVIEKAVIEDKSKANDLAKAAVIVQATWMLIQVIGRLAAKLPVTLLEVNTVAHVLCAFAMYIFWWHKPLLPNEPIVLRDESLAPIVAFMYASSEMSGYVNREHVKSQTLIKTLFAHLNLYSRTPELETLRLIASSSANSPSVSRCPAESNCTSKTTAVLNQHETNLPIPPAEEQILPNGILQRAPDSCLQTLEESRQKDSGTAFFERRPRILQRRPSSEHNSPSELSRQALIEQALQLYPNILTPSRILLTHKDPETSTSPSPLQCIHLRPEQLLANHIQNWPSSDLLRNVDGLIVGMILWLANLCYGGFHAAAWNEHFPSTAEKWLWRISASYIAFCGGFWVILNSAVARWAALNSFWEKWMDGKKSLVQSVALGIVVFVCGFSLFLARIFIVVEAFVSIRELPPGAYDTPEWSDVFPHF